ncbi:MAG TPA: hypothetical protein VGP73_13840 [Thermoanaerobaculia bacterium]
MIGLPALVDDAAADMAATGCLGMYSLTLNARKSTSPSDTFASVQPSQHGAQRARYEDMKPILPRFPVPVQPTPVLGQDFVP